MYGKAWLPKKRHKKRLIGEENEEEDSNNKQLPSRWPELPDTVLHSIFMQLPISDFAAFSSACKPWRSFSNSIKREYTLLHPPLLMFHLPQESRRPYLFYNIKIDKMSEFVLPKCLTNKCIIGSSHGCLIMLDRSYSYLLPQPVVLTSLSQLNKTLTFPMSNLPTNSALLSSPPTSSPGGCLLVTAYSSAFQYNSNLQCCQAGDTKWTVLLQGRTEGMLSASAIKNKVYALVGMQGKFDGEVLIFELDLHPNNRTSVIKTACLQLPGQLRKNRHIHEMQLAQFGDDILLICSYYSHGRLGEFQVYMLDLDGTKWNEVDDLGGCALFLSSNGSVVCREPGRWGGMENSIYFIDRRNDTFWGIYSLKSASVVFRSRVLYQRPFLCCPPWIPRELCF